LAADGSARFALFPEREVTDMNVDMNLDKRKCSACGGSVSIQRFDTNGIQFMCEACGKEDTYTFENEDEAKYYMDEAQQELFGRLREGFIDWQLTNWDQLFKDFMAFLDEHPEFGGDLQFRMALIACLTSGFNRMDHEKYRQCKGRFKATDKMYKYNLKLLRSQVSNPELSDSIEDYQASRAKYVQLRNEYLQTKTAWKMVWKVAKLFLK
jgi:predicted RNA-binding Zn-ribbon protein involved in translation (DUF1610 family)